MRWHRRRYNGPSGPPPGSALDFGHPLMAQICHAFIFSADNAAVSVAGFRDWANPARQLQRRSASGPANMKLAMGRGGTGLQTQPVSSGTTNLTGTSLNTCLVKEGSSQLTYLVRVTAPEDRYSWDGTFNTAGESWLTLLVVDDGFGGVRTDAAPWAAHYFNDGTTKAYKLWVRTGSPALNSELSIHPTGDGMLDNIAMTYDNVNHKVYKNGIQIDSAALSGNLTVAASGGVNTTKLWAPAGHGSDTSTGTRKAFYGVIHYVMVWARALKASELQWLSQDPYAFVQKPSAVRYFVPSVASTSPLFRRTMNGMGARVGSRQMVS